MIQGVSLLRQGALPGPGLYNQLAMLLKYARCDRQGITFSRDPSTGGLLLSIDPTVFGGGGSGASESQVRTWAQDEIHAACQPGGEIYDLVGDMLDDSLEPGGDIYEWFMGRFGAHPFSIVPSSLNPSNVIVCAYNDPSSANAGSIICGATSYPVATTTVAAPVSGTREIYACIYYAGGFITEIATSVPTHQQQWYACIGAVDPTGAISQPMNVDFYNLRVAEMWVP